LLFFWLFDGVKRQVCPTIIDASAFKIILEINFINKNSDKNGCLIVAGDVESIALMNALTTV